MPLPTLPTRQTALVFTLFTANGNSLLGQFKTYRHSVDFTTHNAAALNARYEQNQIAKRRRKFSISLMRDATTGDPRATGLSLSVWNVAGTSRIGNINDLTLTCTTKWKEGSAAKDLDSYPVSVGTGFEVTASEFVATDADLVYQASQDTVLTDFDVTVLITIADLEFSVPMLLSAAVLKADRGEIQMQDVTLKLKGSPTLTLLNSVTFDLYYTVFVGTAQISYAVNTGTGTEVGYALIEKGIIAVKNGEIVDDRYDFLSQGLSAVS